MIIDKFKHCHKGSLCENNYAAYFCNFMPEVEVYWLSRPICMLKSKLVFRTAFVVLIVSIPEDTSIVSESVYAIINTLCLEGRLEGAEKFGTSWAIPDETEKPKDKRIKSGKYIKSKE